MKCLYQMQTWMASHLVAWRTHHPCTSKPSEVSIRAPAAMLTSVAACVPRPRLPWAALGQWLGVAGMLGDGDSSHG